LEVGGKKCNSAVPEYSNVASARDTTTTCHPSTNNPTEQHDGSNDCTIFTVFAFAAAWKANKEKRESPNNVSLLVVKNSAENFEYR
jgi:hypothetical protein